MCAMKGWFKKLNTNRFSLKTQLIAANMVVILVFFSFFSVFIAARTNVAVRTLAKENVDEIMGSAEKYISSLIHDINILLLSFQTKESVQEILSQPNRASTMEDICTLEAELQALDPFQTKISSFELYSFLHDEYPTNATGESVFSTKHMKQDTLFSEMISSGYSTCWYVQDSVSSIHSYVIASKLIRSTKTKETVALLKANVGLQIFTDIVDGLSIAETGKVFLYAKNHLINPSDSVIGEYLVNNRKFINEIITPGEKNNSYMKFNGEQYYVCGYPIEQTDIYIVGAVKLSEFNATQNLLSSTIVWSAIVIIGFLLLFIVIISSKITNPILNMAKKMRYFNYTEEIDTPKDNYGNEITVLQESFQNMHKEINQLIEEVKYEAKVRKIAELKALQAQITPHFLYNTLNSICAMAEKYQAKDIEEMTLAISNFFVNTLNDGGELTDLEHELSHVMSYVYIQKIRYGDTFDVTINLPEELKHYSICKLTLQPLVENCINHAFAEIDYKGEIEINVIKDAEDIIITVIDNGCGALAEDVDFLNQYINREFDITEPVRKYGIHNVNQRIHLYFGENYGLRYEENEFGGFTVICRIKAIEYNGEREEAL